MYIRLPYWYRAGGVRGPYHMQNINDSRTGFYSAYRTLKIPAISQAQLYSGIKSYGTRKLMCLHI